MSIWEKSQLYFPENFQPGKFKPPKYKFEEIGENAGGLVKRHLGEIGLKKTFLPKEWNGGPSPLKKRWEALSKIIPGKLGNFGPEKRML